jgi:hypothetical protein
MFSANEMCYLLAGWLDDNPIRGASFLLYVGYCCCSSLAELSMTLVIFDTSPHQANQKPSI